MKKYVFLILVFGALISCTPKNQYRIHVSVENGPDSLVVHNNWYTSSDTLVLKNGECTFTGVIDTFPKLVSLGFPFPSHENTRMILEPGDIEISYKGGKGFTLGGTENNIIMQQLFDTLKPFEAAVKEKWKAWSDAYNKEPRSKEECEEAWVAQEEVKKRKDEFTRALIRENPNYAGLVITLTMTRYENADNLRFYVEHFKEFAADQRYQNVVKEYEIADRTVNGKPVPGFTFPNPEHKMVSLADFRGKWVLLDFWYVDCPWCRKLSPHLINIYKDWQESKNFEIISISVDKPKDYLRWLEAIGNDGATWTQVLDSTKTYPLEYGITGYPTLILVDPEGNGVKKIVGYQEEGGLKRLLSEFIK